jgi:hypothetical protein
LKALKTRLSKTEKPTQVASPGLVTEDIFISEEHSSSGDDMEGRAKDKDLPLAYRKIDPRELFWKKKIGREKQKQENRNRKKKKNSLIRIKGKDSFATVWEGTWREANVSSK